MRKTVRRRRLSMTSLIDVIFLLLLFFMLSSTFTRFAEVDLSAGGAGQVSEAETRPLFLQLAAEALFVNGEALEPEALKARLAAQAEAAEGPLPVIVALKGEVSAQRLTDLLVLLREVKSVQATVLGAA